MLKSSKHFYEFGPFRVDAVKRRLLREGEIVSLTPKAFDTLLVLIENSGRVVEKDDLMDKVWAGLAVEENNLTQNISALRKALGERRDEPQYILTVSGLGYRFIASVNESWPDDESLRAEGQTKREPAIEEEDYSGRNGNGQTITEPQIPITPPASNSIATGKGRGWKMWAASALVAAILLAGGSYFLVRRARRVETTAAANSQIRSIAILPFKSLGSEGADEYLGLGMADALITKLSSIGQINVRPTNSILKYTNAEQDLSTAGRELGVDSVLEGRVQKAGDRLRVTVQLVRASDGAPLWGDKFDEKYTDIFAVEDRISEEVVEALLPTLTGTQKQQLTKHYTEDTEAYQSYIKGRYFWNKRNSEGLKKAVSYFEDAIIEDPNYALAYAGLADSYATLGVVEDISSQEMLTKARSAAMKALELDDGLAEAHASLGYVKHRFEWDWAGAEREFKRAIELNPKYATAHQWYGWYLLSLSKFDEALDEFKLAQQLEPLSLYTNLTLGTPYFYSRQYEKAAEQYQRVVDMNPDFWLAHWWLAHTYEQEGKYDEALSEYQKMAKLRGENLSQFPIVGYLYAISGKKAEARKILEEQAKEQHFSAYPLAVVYMGLGEKEKALEWLEKSLKERETVMVFLKIDQRFDSLHSDPRFLQLVKELGLPQ
jgi:DNA-binding winged helix-turn-helix (wHTH) protein/TolB-like protein/Flp pilus assembly protein TadD